MGYRRTGPIFGPLARDETGRTLHRQLSDRIREAILAGELTPGSRLPSTRTLASDLGVARNTVLTVFEELVAEGYLESRTGDGTYVAPELPDDFRRPVPTPVRRDGSEPAPVSPRLGIVETRPPDPTAIRPFVIGIPGLDAFPLDLWNRLLLRRARRASLRDLAYEDPAGLPSLRQEIASYLGTSRGVRCTPEQVIVVSSAQQGIDLTLRVLTDRGDRVWLEDPGYLSARGAMELAGSEIIPVPVDDQGLDVERGIAAAPQARLVYVTPSHQYPTGVLMSLERRHELLRWADTSGAWIVEDDYDSEYRYRGRPIAALQGIDGGGRVVYLGTFAKALFPSLRAAYLVVPEPLVEPFRTARSFIDRAVPTLTQHVVSDFMAAGHFTAHLRKMRVLYAERRCLLVEACERFFGDRLALGPEPAGLHVLAELPEGTDDVELSERAARAGLIVGALSRFCLGSRRSGLLLGFAPVRERDIGPAVERLDEAIGSLMGVAKGQSSSDA